MKLAAAMIGMLAGATGFVLLVPRLIDRYVADELARLGTTDDPPRPCGDRECVELGLDDHGQRIPRPTLPDPGKVGDTA